MSDFPIENLPVPVIGSPFSENATGVEFAAISQATPGSTATGTANLVRLVPFRFGQAVTIVKLWAYKGATIAGNCDMAIYTEDGSVIVNSGSVAMSAGGSTLQEFAITATTLPRGRYFIGIGSDSTTATFFSNTTPVAIAKILGYAQATITLPLTSNITPVAYAAAIVPSVGYSLRTLVL